VLPDFFCYTQEVTFTKKEVLYLAFIEFTENYEDLSTDMGFQFKFYCERCKDGYMSTFKANALGVVGGLLKGASNIVGGIFGKAQDTAYEVQRVVG